MKKKSNSNNEPNIEIGKIDKVIHEPARMKIMINLYFVDSMDAIFLLRQTGLTWGNLATHTKKLEAAGYIEVKKEFIKRKPHTMFKLTKKGRNAFEEYRKNMKEIIDEIL
jgi:DNA-binding MarR family transcriptional regulator